MAEVRGEPERVATVGCERKQRIKEFNFVFCLSAPFISMLPTELIQQILSYSFLAIEQFERDAGSELVLLPSVDFFRWQRVCSAWRLAVANALSQRSFCTALAPKNTQRQI